MEDCVFVIDTSPAPQRNNLDVPQYQVGRKSVELLQLEKESTPKFGRFPQHSNHCWNCGKKNHSIRECRAEYNHITVEWNKTLLTMKKEYDAKKFQKRSNRYHQADNLDDDRSCRRPGPISSQLRQVLGLSDHELPPYVYRLRSHGYPKAWLKHATVRPSGINLYDAHGNEVADPDAEDGEVLEEEDKIKYDLSKLIQFPGFNAPLPENSIDDYERMKSPPFSEEQSLENMLTELKEKAVTEYQLRKNTSSSTAAMNSSQNSQDSSDDMEVDCSLSSSLVETGFVAPLPNDDNKPLTPPPPGMTPPPLGDDAKSTSSQTDSECTLNDLSQDSKSSQCSDPNKSLTTSSSQNGLGRILSSAEGTPLLKSKFGHARLPPPENFSKDICDVIYFENLPESTGKFERMRNLLKKVKSILGIKRQNS
ncbi:hypothetical protein V9T40_000983 [Parthenolecanium corni]|uniref:CCHC-type domain-containing protein n=1 Tax=Parthenolecanium corni TaxID=536013 RepID=A0AAN9TC41_9HEMI